MGHRLTFAGTLRLLWVAVNVSILIASVSGYRDLSMVTLLLSFPASAVAAVMLEAGRRTLGWTAPADLLTSVIATTAFVCGYVQWFVIGPAAARRIPPYLASRPMLRVLVRVAVVLSFVALGALGWEMMRAQEQAKAFFNKAMTIRDGMNAEEVRSILGDPAVVRDRKSSSADTESGCLGHGASQVAFYSYEHKRLPRRLSKGGFVFEVCTDVNGRVIRTSTIWVDQ